MTRTSGLDFGSDPAHQWERELFHLAEVCPLPSAILLCAVLPSCLSMTDFSFFLKLLFTRNYQLFPGVKYGER